MADFPTVEGRRLPPQSKRSGLLAPSSRSTRAAPRSPPARGAIHSQGQGPIQLLATERQTMTATTLTTEPYEPAAVRRVSWGSIFVGTVVALALMVLFTTLGLAIGAAAVDPLYDSDPASGLGTGSAIYLVVTQLISLAVGGFAAARLAGVPRTVASILHGAAVWALATIFLTWAAITGSGALFGAASTVLGNTASGAASAVRAVTPDTLSFPDLSEIASRVSMDDLPPEIRQTLQDNGVTPEQLREEARGAYRDVVSQQEQQRAVNILQGALADALRQPGQIGSTVDDALDSLVTGPNAVFSQEDRQEIVQTLQRRLDLTPEQSEQMVQSLETRTEAAVEDLRQTLEQIQQQALETAQQASSVLASTALSLTIASLLGLAAALGGAFVGKPDGFLGDRLDDHHRRV